MKQTVAILESRFPFYNSCKQFEVDLSYSKWFARGVFFYYVKVLYDLNGFLRLFPNVRYSSLRNKQICKQLNYFVSIHFCSLHLNRLHFLKKIRK